ncbi:unnamed protein product [Bursaphelenchus okinawaensis]|uniref:Uncharacterized protein n=1 Tax=Bursaphelenchus okinawaensis TaxID=465554 RepID=A0A811KIE6_9BILA|nr:unnamed protein product [Bursaphelenchus okinawaensis]CAG9103788.1 unnamed protein product [Bursaphelenchus okinawaensis]
MSNTCLNKERFSPKAALESFRSKIHLGRRNDNKDKPEPQMPLYSPSASPSTQSLNSVTSSTSYASRCFISQKKRSAPAPPSTEVVQNVVIKTYHHDLVERKIYDQKRLSQETPKREERVVSTGRRLFTDEERQIRLVEFEDSKSVINGYNKKVANTPEGRQNGHASSAKLESKFKSTNSPAIALSQPKSNGTLSEAENLETRQGGTNSPLKFFDNTDKIYGNSVEFKAEPVKKQSQHDQVYVNLNRECVKLRELLLDWNQKRTEEAEKVIEAQKRVLKQIQLIDDLFKYNCLKEKINKSESSGRLEDKSKQYDYANVEETNVVHQQEPGSSNSRKVEKHIVNGSNNIDKEDAGSDSSSGIYNWRQVLKTPVKQQSPWKFMRSNGMSRNETDTSKTEGKEQQKFPIVGSQPQFKSPEKKKEVDNNNVTDHISKRDATSNIYSSRVTESSTSFLPKTWIMSRNKPEVQAAESPSEKQIAGTSLKTLPKKEPFHSRIKVELEPESLDSSTEEPVPVSVKQILNDLDLSSDCEDISIDRLTVSPNQLHTIFEASEDNSEPEEVVEPEKEIPVNIVRPSTSAPPPPPPPLDVYTQKAHKPVVLRPKKHEQTAKGDGDKEKEAAAWSQLMADIRARAAEMSQKSEKTS